MEGAVGMDAEGGFRMFPALAAIPAVIETVGLYRVDVRTERHFSFGTWHNRQHGFLKLSGGGGYGWGEEIVSLNDELLDIAKWGARFAVLKGMTVSEALRHVRLMLPSWGARCCEMAEMALLDLAGRLQGKPALELLGLPRDGTVPGLYCVLERELGKVKEGVKQSLEYGFISHLKLKLFGDGALDCEIVRLARDMMGERAYILGDANNGYRESLEPSSVDGLVRPLLSLAEASLNGCEDPGMMSNPQWAELQAKVGKLDLIPDYPMRPARQAALDIVPGMGRIYNIHPGSAGSLLDAVQLARRVREIGGKLMIGDNSLIGPACTVWQQLAIGLRAEWVEAVEKPRESEAFFEALEYAATSRQANGEIGITGCAAGFGLELDEKRLRERSAGYAAL